MVHRLVKIIAFAMALLIPPVAWALEDCNLNPQGMQDITKALQCLDRNIRTLGSPTVSLSSSPIASVSLSGKYIAGVYTTPGGKRRFTLSGPTKLGDREKWTLTSDDEEVDLSWITGPPKGHPMLLGTKLADDLSSAYDYGKLGKTSNIASKWWTQGRLIGITSSSDGLTISRFHNDPSKDDLTENASFSLRLSKDVK